VRVLGIDPGVKGAVALFAPDASPRISDFPLPTVNLRIGNKSRTRMDFDDCWLLMLGLTATYEPNMAFIEDVNGFGGNPNATAAAGGVLMTTVGALEMALVATQTPRHKVTPSVWTKAMKVKAKTSKERKDASRVLASQLFPESANLFGRVKDDGVAEAALLAYYGATHILGYTP
jgi:crossover junction endodeoxyribonuclease RuvC